MTSMTIDITEDILSYIDLGATAGPDLRGAAPRQDWPPRQTPRSANGHGPPSCLVFNIDQPPRDPALENVTGRCHGETGDMRKQYHFWPGAEGLDAWDVDRLIDMSASFVGEEVPLTAIWEVDTVYWFDETQQPTVRKVLEHVRLIEEVDLSYPIILGPDGRVMDGMHRVARASWRGETDPCGPFAELPDPDFRNCRPDELPY